MMCKSAGIVLSSSMCCCSDSLEMTLKAVKGALEIVLTSGPKEYCFMALEEVLSLRVCSQWFCVGEQLIF